MYKKKECVAMLLAGGQGSRLYTLTEKTAKPAVPFGGKYRIIDFPLSNCINSGIDTVGVLTQYQPLVLNEYIGNGQPWDLDRNDGGVTVLPPYRDTDKAGWYKGTANAIYQNLTFINRYDPEFVLVLSGDHIYKMDYSKMIAAHRASGADCTIAVINVPIEEASRFGIMNTDGDNRIFEFEEKPKAPKGTKASMGIYVFSRTVLEEYLVRDENTEGSSNDFGKNVIPALLADGKKLYAYEFAGYWKDVGTIDSLWNANMDLLGDVPVYDIHDKSWRIFSRNSANPPQYIGKMARVDDAVITEGDEIYGEVRHSVLFSDVLVEEGAVVEDSVIMQNCIIRRGAVVRHAIIDENVEIGEGACVGRDAPDSENKIAVVGNGCHVLPGDRILPGETINSTQYAKRGK